MKHENKRAWIAVGIAVVLTGCHRDRAAAAHEEYLADTRASFPETLSGAAWQTHAAYVRALNAGEVGQSDGIPPLYWADEIKRMNPIRVYAHRANIVVVLGVADNVESGKYISIPISSYLPMPGVDGFEFDPSPVEGREYHGREVLDYTRKLEFQRGDSPGVEPRA